MADLMRRTCQFLVSILLATLLSPVGAVPAEGHRGAVKYYVTAGQLLKECESDLTPEHLVSHDPRGELVHIQDKMTCLGYLLGVADILSTTGAVCLAPTTTIRDPHEIVASYLLEHPGLMERAASQVVTLALSESYPCW